jgi:hypothetical protein
MGDGYRIFRPFLIISMVKCRFAFMLIVALIVASGLLTWYVLLMALLVDPKSKMISKTMTLFVSKQKIKPTFFFLDFVFMLLYKIVFVTDVLSLYVKQSILLIIPLIILMVI